MDHICKTGEKTQHFPHEKPPPYSGHILARQSDQRRGPVPRWPPYFVHPAQTAQTSLAGPRPPHGRWAHPKRHHLRRTGIWKEKHRPPAATLQGCREERYEGTWHQHRNLGRHRSWPRNMEKHPKTTPEDRRRKADERNGWPAGTPKGTQHLRQTRDPVQMWPLRQRLLLPHWTL